MKWPWSYWEQDLFLSDYDLLVVGAGFSGLATAYFMKELQPNWKIIVIDQHYFQRAASTRNAGFACISSLSELIEDADQYGWDDTMQLIEWRWKGLKNIEKYFDKKEIGWKTVPSGEFFLTDGKFQSGQYLHRIEEANSHVRSIVGSDYYTPKKMGPHPLHRNAPFIEHAKEGQLHPVKLYDSWRRKCLSLGIQILENTKVLNHIPGENGRLRVSTNQLQLEAKRILFCTNGEHIPSDDEVRQTSNLVLMSTAFKNGLPDFNAHAEAGYIYIRNVSNRLLIGGGRHILPSEEQHPLSSNNKMIIKSYLKDVAHKYLQGIPENWTVEYEWEGIMGTGQPKMPIMKAVDNNVFVLGRLSGMGVALSAYLGQEMAKIIDRT